MKFDSFIQAVRKIKNETEKIYIYGAGFYGKDVYRILKDNDILVDGFLVTKSFREDSLFDLPVFIADTVLEKNIGIIIGVSDTYVNEIKQYLCTKNFNMTHVIDGGTVITQTGGREDLRNSKVLEVSTTMGCTVNCHYCPQTLMLHEYYKNDKKRQRLMTIDNFKTILNNTPQNCIIDFSGMTESFNNPNCLEMIEMACDAGRKVYLFSTLAGVSERDVDRLVKMPIYYMTLHVADKKKYANIPTTESYYRNVELVTSSRKNDGSPFVDFVNSQTEPDERVADICKNRFEIMQSVQNRAGNVKDETAQHRERIISENKKIKCCFCGDDLSNNVVLPDGTLLLCNMDYGMQHILGNLYEEDYDSIRKGSHLQDILKALNCEGKMDNLLCRNCLLAREE